MCVMSVVLLPVQKLQMAQFLLGDRFAFHIEFPPFLGNDMRNIS
jgi:hypothetical protein